MEQEKPITKDSRSSSEKPIIEEMYVTQKDEPAIEPKRKNNIFSFKGRATRTEYWLVTFI